MAGRARQGATEAARARELHGCPKLSPEMTEHLNVDPAPQGAALASLSPVYRFPSPEWEILEVHGHETSSSKSSPVLSPTCHSQEGSPEYAPPGLC